MQRCTNYFVYAMPMGRLSIAADEAGICAIAFGDVAHDGPRRPSALTNKAATQLQEYFAGKRRFFDIPLSPHGTEFPMAKRARTRKSPKWLAALKAFAR